jgi:hypothetical protein
VPGSYPTELSASHHPRQEEDITTRLNSQQRHLTPFASSIKIQPSTSPLSSASFSSSSSMWTMSPAARSRERASSSADLPHRKLPARRCSLHARSRGRLNRCDAGSASGSAGTIDAWRGREEKKTRAGAAGAIIMSFHLNGRQRKDVVIPPNLIVTDSKNRTTCTIGLENQPAVEALSSQLLRPRHHLVAEFLRMATRTQEWKGAQYQYKLTIRWTAGHAGIEGNG